MPEPLDPLPAEVVAALRRSNSAHAVTLLHESTGISVVEAKAVIDEHLRRTGKPRGTILSLLGLPFAVSSALKRGDKVEAIRLLREKGGMGPKEAQEAVAGFETQSNATESHASPGEVPKSSAGFWLVVALVVAALLSYLLLSRAS